MPLVRRAVELATGICGERVLLVVGHDWHSVVAACHPCPGFLSRNDGYESGLGTSISHAVRSIQHVAGAVILLFADQPLINAEHVRAIRNAWDGTDLEIVATSYAGTSGPPVLFARGCFGDLVRLKGDQGARTLLHDDRYAVTTLNFEDAAFDIDTVEDLERLV